MSQSAETSGKPAPATPAWGLDYGPAVEMGRQSFDQWTRGLFEYANELSLFAMARFNHDFDTWRALANCTNLGEVSQCHADFAQKVTADYAAEAGKLIELIMGMAGNAVTTGVPARQRQRDDKSTWQLTPAAAGTPRHAPSRPRQATGAKTAADRDA